MLLILVKLADFSMRRDARNEFDGLAITRAKRLSSARTVMIDGLFSNLSDKKMIRELRWTPSVGQPEGAVKL